MYSHIRIEKHDATFKDKFKAKGKKRYFKTHCKQMNDGRNFRCYFSSNLTSAATELVLLG